MTRTDCGREAQTIRAAWNGAGIAADEELSAHLASCRSCAEIAMLATAMREDRDAACADAQPPSSAVVWWRAQRRAREEAARSAERPIALVHAVSLGCAVAAAAALASMSASPLHEWLVSWGLGGTWQAVVSRAEGSGLGWPAVAMLVLAASLIVVPLAISLALAEDS